MDFEEHCRNLWQEIEVLMKKKKEINVALHSKLSELAGAIYSAEKKGEEVSILISDVERAFKETKMKFLKKLIEHMKKKNFKTAEQFSIDEEAWEILRKNCKGNLEITDLSKKSKRKKSIKDIPWEEFNSMGWIVMEGELHCDDLEIYVCNDGMYGEVKGPYREVMKFLKSLKGGKKD